MLERAGARRVLDECPEMFRGRDNYAVISLLSTSCTRRGKRARNNVEMGLEYERRSGCWWLLANRHEDSRIGWLQHDVVGLAPRAPLPRGSAWPEIVLFHHEASS